MALDFPANPTNGQAYGSYIYNSTIGAWQSKEDPATVAVTSTTAPASANNGDIWYNTNTGVSYVYYNDGTSAQWVEIVSSALPNLNTKANLSGATFTGNISAPQLISTTATGTTPLTIASTTLVSNLNADLLDGQHASAFSPVAGSSSIATVGTITSGTWNGSTLGVQYGGTGAQTLTNGGYLKGTGTAAITSQTGIPAGDITSGTIGISRLPVTAYATGQGGQLTVSSTTPTTVASCSITTNGRPVLIIGTGNMNPIDASVWHRIYLYRDSTPIGNYTVVESRGASWNTAFALNHIEAPAAGTYIYSIRAALGAGQGQYGEEASAGAQISVVEL